MRKRFSITWSITAIVGVVLLVAVPAAAMAAPAPPHVSRSLGTITASGGGVAAARGTINLDAKSGGAVLLVMSKSNVTVKTDGKRSATAFNGFTIYTNVHRANVTGSDASAILIGRKLSLHLTGSGTAHFRGAGTFGSSRGRGAWTADGVTVPLGPARP